MREVLRIFECSLGELSLYKNVDEINKNVRLFQFFLKPKVRKLKKLN